MLASVLGWAAAVSIVFCAAVQGPPPPPPMPPPGTMATSSATQVISPVALATWVTRYGPDGVHSLDLLVLWRGDPGWFMRGTSRSTSGGGNADAFRSTIRYGDLDLQVALHFAKRTAEIQGAPVELRDANVVLVDRVDAPNGPQVVGTLRIDPDVPMLDGGRPHIAAVVGRSSEVVAFLRCEAAMPNGQGQAMIDRICAQVLGKLPQQVP